MLNLSIGLEESAQRYPNNIAFTLGQQQLSYQQLNKLANQTANSLVKLGLKKGDRVALTCPNILFFPVIYYGILKAGGTVAPLNTLLKQTEIAYHLRDLEARFYFCFHGSNDLPMSKFGYDAFLNTESCEHFIEISPQLIDGKKQHEKGYNFEDLVTAEDTNFESYPTEADDIAIILYTSGTTGQAKGAQLTHFNMFYNAKTCIELFEMTSNEKELVILPLFHSFGQTVLMNATILIASTAILLPKFSPKEALKLMVEHQITIFAGVPTIYWALLNHPEIDQYTNNIKPHLRLAVSGGAALPVQILKDFKTKFEAPILEGYGLSETSPIACFNHLHKPNKVGSIGTPVWGVSMQINDKTGKELPNGEVGEVVIKGHNIMQGYLNRPEENEIAIRNGWFYTGDLGKKDDDNYFYIVDRSKDMIIKDGFNVYPREIEECIIKHESVSLVAVIGVPNEKHGEEIKALVLLKEKTNSTPAQLGTYCRKNLANYKVPRIIEIVESLPISATGKILKRKLK
jgi:long-chain acyl-CoA synthetase